MRILLQRVTSGKVLIADQEIAAISAGLVLFVGISSDDTEQQSNFLAEKVAHLRIFEDKAGKMNLSLLDAGGAALVVSQFTLYANTQRGRRPSFVAAAPPEIAAPLVEHFAERLRNLGVPVEMGRFGAHMQIDLVNDGPVTISLEKN